MRALALSTGFFACMPSLFYTDLVHLLAKKYDSVVPLSFPGGAAGLDRLCDDLGVDQVSLLAHSSLDPSILRSPRLSCAVLVDPAVTPLRGELTCITPVTVVCTAGYDSFVPPPFQPWLRGDVCRHTLQWGGHADILDDTYADAGNWAGMYSADRGARKLLRTFVANLC